MASGGGSPNIATPPASPPPVKRSGVEIEASKADLREMMRRKQGLASTRLTTPGTLYGNKGLRQTLG